jgi:FKBP-type peptidyl-prolyl cis-trans isomerase 2
LIRILEVSDRLVVVDTNRRWAGQALDLEVELLTIDDPDAGADSRDRERERPASTATDSPGAEHVSTDRPQGVDNWRDYGGQG